MAGEQVDYPLTRDGVNWTLEETRMAFVLYITLDKRFHTRRSEPVLALARALGRKPGSVSSKIGNIQEFDPYTQAKGRGNASKHDRQVWELYKERGHAFLEESMVLLATALAKADPAAPSSTQVGDIKVTEVHVWTKQRVCQQRFRNRLLENYDRRCCLTGMQAEEMLVASHIKPWADATDEERLNPGNGLLLNAYHDRAFDKGLITLDGSLRVVVSDRLKRRYSSASPDLRWLAEFEGEKIAVPAAFPPDPKFLAWHNERVFLDSRAS